MKKIIFIIIQLSVLFIINSQEVELTTTLDWAYTNEIININIKIEESKIRKVKEVKIEPVLGGFILLESNKQHVVGYNTVEDRSISYYNYSYKLVSDRANKLEIKGEVFFDDGLQVESNNITIDLFKINEYINPIVHVHSFNQKSIAGVPFPVMVDIMGTFNNIDQDSVLLNIKADNVKLIKNELKRNIYLYGKIIPIKSFTLAVTFNNQGSFNLTDNFFNVVDYINNESVVITSKINPIKIDVKERSETKNIFAIADFIQIETELFPTNVTLNQERQFFIKVTTDGFFNKNSIKEFLKLPNLWNEELVSYNEYWVNDTIYREMEFAIYGIFKANKSYNFGVLKIPYTDLDGKKHVISKKLGRVKGQYNPPIFLIVIILIIIFAIVISVLQKRIRFRFIKNNEDFEYTNNDLPLKEINNGKIQKFSKQFELTKREEEILGILVHGKSTKEISEDLFISPETTKKHIKNIMKKTDASTRLEILIKIANFN